jgi:hypothetical protein
MLRNNLIQRVYQMSVTRSSILGKHLPPDLYHIVVNFVRDEFDFSIKESLQIAKTCSSFIHDRIMAEFWRKTTNVNTYSNEDQVKEKETLRKMLPPNPADEDDNTSYNSFLVDAHILIEHIDKMYAIGFKFYCECAKCNEFRDESGINSFNHYTQDDYEGDDPCQEHGTGEHHPTCMCAKV